MNYTVGNIVFNGSQMMDYRSKTMDATEYTTIIELAEKDKSIVLKAERTRYRVVLEMMREQFANKGNTISLADYDWMISMVNAGWTWQQMKAEWKKRNV